jgi:hypothetical protein
MSPHPSRLEDGVPRGVRLPCAMARPPRLIWQMKDCHASSRHDWGNSASMTSKQSGSITPHLIVLSASFNSVHRKSESEMIDKTLETFHPSNMVLQQWYCNNKYKKYSKLIQVLLVAEIQNDLLMKNFFTCYLLEHK